MLQNASPILGKATALALTALLLAGCGSSPREQDAAQLALACETVECECRAIDQGTFEETRTAPIVWSPRGPAGCPEGYRLWRVEKDFLGRRK